MAGQTYNGWTEQREYRVWSAEDIWQVTTVLKHSNGWFTVETDGYDVPYKTRSESEAYSCAQQRTETGVREATDACPCHGEDYDQWEREECEDAAQNVYGDSHGVRTQVVDYNEDRTLEPYEL